MSSCLRRVLWDSKLIVCHWFCLWTHSGAPRFRAQSIVRKIQLYIYWYLTRTQSHTLSFSILRRYLFHQTIVSVQGASINKLPIYQQTISFKDNNQSIWLRSPSSMQSYIAIGLEFRLRRRKNLDSRYQYQVVLCLPKTRDQFIDPCLCLREYNHSRSAKICSFAMSAASVSIKEHLNVEVLIISLTVQIMVWTSGPFEIPIRLLCRPCASQTKRSVPVIVHALVTLDPCSVT